MVGWDKAMAKGFRGATSGILLTAWEAPCEHEMVELLVSLGKSLNNKSTVWYRLYPHDCRAHLIFARSYWWNMWMRMSSLATAVSSVGVDEVTWVGVSSMFGATAWFISPFALGKCLYEWEDGSWEQMLAKGGTFSIPCPNADGSPNLMWSTSVYSNPSSFSWLSCNSQSTSVTFGQQNRALHLSLYRTHDLSIIHSQLFPLLFNE